MNDKVTSRTCNHTQISPSTISPSLPARSPNVPRPHCRYDPGTSPERPPSLPCTPCPGADGCARRGRCLAVNVPQFWSATQRHERPTVGTRNCFPCVECTRSSQASWTHQSRLFPKYQRALTVPYDAPDQRKHLHAVYIWLQPLDVRHVPDKFRLSLDGRSNVGRTPLEGCPRTVLLCLDDGQSGGKRVIPQRLCLSRVSMGQVRKENIRPEPRGRLCPAGQSIPHRTPGRRVAD